MFAKRVTNVFFVLSLLEVPLPLTGVVGRPLPMDAWATVGTGAATGCTLTETVKEETQNGYRVSCKHHQVFAVPPLKTARCKIGGGENRTSFGAPQ